ncbi:MAG: ATP-binding cassette domain-containing protein [Trueperaceae bacterium]|nr:ATP-binding cassette domain-containing protein [Trueperaceae bacterium]
MISVKHIKKRYASFEALKGLSFDIQDGEIVGLLGPNGAGKTTTIKILTGFLQPDEGEVVVNGQNVIDQTAKAQAEIGYLPENAPLYPELSVQDYLEMIADIREIPAKDKKTYLRDAVTATALTDRLNTPIGQLSKGYRQRVGLAQAILHKPKLLILDEPTVGLDPTQLLEIRSLIKHLSERATILFSSHILPEVEALCDRAIILMNGSLRADARLSDLANSANAVVTFERETEARDKLAGLESAQYVEMLTTEPGYRVIGKPGSDLCPQIFRLAKEHNWPLRELRHEVRTLETVFNDLANSHVEEVPVEEVSA